MSDRVLLLLSTALAFFAGPVLWLTIRLTAVRIRSTAEVRCPSCGTRDVRHSHGRGLRDAVYRWFSCSPYRCRSCWTRFYRHLAQQRAAMEAE